MRIIEQLVYKITGDNSEFDKSITQSESKVSKFGSVADKMFAGVTVAAIGMAVKKMGEMVMASATALDRVDKLSQKIGLSRTAFQEWDYILGQSGASVEGLQMSLKTLSGAADEASKGNKQYKDSFDKLGVSVVDVNGNMKDQETLFNEVFSALADMENQTERTALASDLLGRSATELAPTLNTSKEGIEQLRQEAHDLGLVYSDELVDAGVVLGDNIDRLKKSFEAFKTKALAPIIGLAVTFTDKLLGQNTASGNLKDSYNNLKTAVENYNTILDESKGKTDAITQATIEQAEAARGVALALLGSEYDDAKKKSAGYEKTIANLSKAMKNESIATMLYTNALGISLEGLANSSLTEHTITSKLLDSRKFSNDQILSFLDTLRNYKDQQDAIAEANKDKIESDAKVLQFVNQLTVGYLNNDDATKLLLATYPEIKQKVLDNVEAYNKEQEAINARNEEILQASEDFKEYSASSDEVLQGLIEEAQKHSDSAYYAELHRLATEKLNEAIIANGAETDKVDKILDNHAQGMESITNYALALGDSYDENTEKASLLTSTIRALIDSGVDPESEAVAGLVAQLKALGAETEEVADSTADAYAEIERSRMDEYQLALDNIEKQADAYLEAGVSIVEVEKWKNEELARLQEEQADKAEEEAERTRKAWEDAAWSMLGSVTSIWGSINQVQANQNEEELNRIKEKQKDELDILTDKKDTELALLKDKLDTGIISEEAYEKAKEQIDAEYTASKDLQEAELNSIKAKYAKEEADRNKALSTLSVVLDTAKAIMQIWANPLIAPWAKGVWTGLAAGAGAAQIAAINSAPVPSYDVGSIRIPETQTATVHKDEMILTAPQAEQARREGITIAPVKSGGNSVNLVIYLDGKEIARNTIDNLNSGSVGTIKARVVK